MNTHEYKGLTTSQYLRVVELAKKLSKSTDEIVNEIIDWVNEGWTIKEVINMLELMETIN
jgi:hypothetical protein